MLTFNTEIEFEELELCMRRYIYSTSIDVVKYCSITLFPHQKNTDFCIQKNEITARKYFQNDGNSWNWLN